MVEKRHIREQKEIEIRREFKKNHKKTKENEKEELTEHLLRWEKEKEIRKIEDEDENFIKNEENENIEKILREIKRQRDELKEQRRRQIEFERDYIRRQREEYLKEEGIIDLSKFNSKILEKNLPDEKNPCIICLSNMVANEIVIILPCTHIFHEDCINK